MRKPLLLLLFLVAFARLAVVWAYTHPLWTTETVAHLVADLATWPPFFMRVRSGLVPYVDFPKEYPVGAGILYWPLSFFVNPHDLKEITWVHGVFMTLGDLLGASVFYSLAARKTKRWALALSLLFSLNLTALLLSPIRFEGWVVLFALLGYLFHEKERPLLATFCWSLGSALKWFPALLIAAQEWKAFREGKRTQWIGSGLVFFAATAALNLPFAFADYARNGSLREWLSPYLFHLVRPLYWDTLLGVGELWLGPLSFERYGSVWTLGLVLLVLLSFPRMRLAQKATLLFASALLLNRVYSAQFQLWFYPFLLLCLVKSEESLDRGLLWLFLALDLLNILVYPVSFVGAYRELGGFEPWRAVGHGSVWTIVFSLAIVARTVALLALGGALIRRERPQPLTSS